MKLRIKWLVILTTVLLILSLTTMFVNAKKGGTPTSDLGDLYGDLVEIYREPVNGIPILDDNGCEILINATDGSHIFMDYDEDANSCTIPEDADVIEVSFGRLNVARSPSSVLESAFDEAIMALNEATNISLDNTGRFLLEREAVDEDGTIYLYWKEIDASRENLALYKKLLHDGHIEGHLGSDPFTTSGDAVVLRPVLNVTHFNEVVDPNVNLDYLLNNSGDPEDLLLDQNDLMSAASFLAGSADKTGHITDDLVFYLNSILELNIKDCEGGYETYVDFDPMDYFREDEYTKQVYVLHPEMNGENWVFGHWVQEYVWLMNTGLYSGYMGSNPDVFIWDTDEAPSSLDIQGFAQASDDALRVISYTHDYKIPPQLGE